MPHLTRCGLGPPLGKGRGLNKSLSLTVQGPWADHHVRLTSLLTLSKCYLPYLQGGGLQPLQLCRWRLLPAEMALWSFVCCPMVCLRGASFGCCCSVSWSLSVVWQRGWAGSWGAPSGWCLCRKELRGVLSSPSSSRGGGSPTAVVGWGRESPRQCRARVFQLPRDLHKPGCTHISETTRGYRRR